MVLNTIMELTAKQLYRKEKIKMALSGLYTNRQLAVELNVTIGHAKVIKRNYRKKGDKSLIHGNTGRTPVHALTEEEIQRILEIKESKNEEGKKYLRMLIFRISQTVFRITMVYIAAKTQFPKYSKKKDINLQKSTG